MKMGGGAEHMARGPGADVDAGRLAQVREAFEAAIGLPAGDRAAQLDHLCRGDPEVRAEVESLLAAQDGVGTFLSTPVLAMTGTASLLEGGWTAGALLGKTLGPYRITGLLGHGGMGVVYRAEQDHPHRTVALKLIRSPLLAPTLRHRFEREATILARLKHPGIAQIYGAGSLPDEAGKPIPYFAMELVEGPPLLEFAASRALGTRARLELFVQICDAVDHAHQRAVVHRDLKPGNILVEDGPRPKVLDFGVARATDADVTVTVHTAAGQVIGTLQYMSPEQVRGDAEHVDARSDVYALGVILFELLTGKLPYDLRNRSLPDAARVIGEEDPTRLSMVERRLRGDVETIVAKALEKDPARRYASAAALAADVRRYLADRPIVARPASTAYQLRKFARRNRVLVAGVIATFVALVGGVIGTGIGLVRATRAQGEALESARIAREAADRAQREADNANAVALFMRRAFEAAHPGRTRDRGTATTIDEFLEFAANRIDEWARGRPEVQALLLEEVGAACASSGRYERARTLLERAVETRRTLSPPDPLRLATCLSRLGDLYAKTGDHRRHAEAQHAALAEQRRANLVDPTHLAIMLQGVADAYANAGDFEKAEALYVEAADAIGDRAGRPVLLASGLSAMAFMLEQQERYAEAETMLRRAIVHLADVRTGDFSEDQDAALCNLAWILYRQGRLDEAEQHARKSVAGKLAMFKPGHLRIATGQVTLGLVLQALGNFDEAEPMLREALASRIKAMPPGAKAITEARLALAECLARKGEGEEAAALLALVEADDPGSGPLAAARSRDIDVVRRLLPGR